MNIQDFWDAVLRQDAERVRAYFWDNAYVNWHCTNERFTVEEYVRANCEYPGDWDGVIERTETIGDLTVTAVNVYAKDRSVSFHVVSFLKIEEDRIRFLDEYWGDDGVPPRWRQEMNIGVPIR